MDSLCVEIQMCLTLVSVFCILLPFATTDDGPGWAKDESARGIIGWFARFSARG